MDISDILRHLIFRESLRNCPKPKPTRKRRQAIAGIDEVFEAEKHLIAVSQREGQQLEVCDPCPSGWYRILDSCIWLSRDKKDFDSAQKQCAQLVDNGRLFEPKNSLQNDLVSTLIKSLEPSSALIGLTDRQSEGRFAYLSSGKEPSFSNWSPGEPNDWGSGEDCAHFFFKLMNGNNVHDSQWGKWNDVPCNMKWHYVCEKPLTT